jgi:hypothetical protein
MWYLTKAGLAAIIVLVPCASFADGLCKSGLVGITLVAGSCNPPCSFPPDSESFKPEGKIPDNIIELGWHNLRKAERPLKLICRYPGGKAESMVLDPKIDTCVVKHGLVAFCE